MVISRSSLRWAALAGLWILVGLLGFLMAVQILLVALGPTGSWQLPRTYQVTVDAFDPDPQTEFPAIFVTGADGKERVISLLKQERVALKLEEEVWILDNVYRSRLRPGQFRLTPLRLLIEFPQPVLILALLLIWRLRRAQVRAAKLALAAPRVRTVLRDDFHARAERFAAAPDEPQAEP